MWHERERRANQSWGRRYDRYFHAIPSLYNLFVKENIKPISFLQFCIRGILAIAPRAKYEILNQKHKLASNSAFEPRWFKLDFAQLAYVDHIIYHILYPMHFTLAKICCANRILYRLHTAKCSRYAMFFFWNLICVFYWII